MDMQPTTAPTPTQTAVEKSVAKESAFSKPGTMGKSSSKGWKPATGTRFRPMSVKPRPGRKRIHKRDPRYVEFF